MKIDIRNLSTQGTTELIEHTEHKSLFKLGRFQKYIQSVIIRFEDINGPKGGIDKACRIKIKGTFGTKIIECRDIDFFIATDRALETAEHSIRRIVEKAVTRPRQVRSQLNTEYFVGYP